MKVYRPRYCEEFKCIAERCRHSCCVGWEIWVDEATLDKYNSLGREDILCHIDEGEIILSEGERCPFLCESGLCRIISELSDEYTSLICQEHPRFYHRVGDRVEGGIGLCCEEACRIILSSDRYSEFSTVEHNPDLPESTDFDSISHRDYLYSLLLDKSLSFIDKIGRIRERYSLPEVHSLAEWNEILADLELLHREHEGLLSLTERTGEHYEIYTRFLAYLIFRHLSVAQSYDNLRARLGFCLLLTDLLSCHTVEREMSFEEICEIARIISEEIEYSEDNTASLIFEIESEI